MVAGFLTTEALDLNDFCPKAGEHLGAAGSGLMASQVNNANTVQRSFDVCHVRHSLTSLVVWGLSYTQASILRAINARWQAFLAATLAQW
jgi:hypothetical protein